MALNTRGLVVFGEHRFFGTSYPGTDPTKAFTDENKKYITVEQAMNDYVMLIKSLH